MQVRVLMSALLVLSLAAPAVAQDWTEFANAEDGFKLNFPGEPTVETTTWTSEYEYELPARVYRAERGPERYSMTVVDYRVVEEMGIARAKACPPGAEPCTGQVGGNIGAGYWKNDVRGAMMYATFQFLKRDADLTHLMWNWNDLVEGHLVQLQNRADQSRTFAAIHMHDNRLYVAEGTVPEGRPAPGLFQQSMGFVNSNGEGIRYQGMLYSNAYHGLGEYEAPPYRRAPPQGCEPNCDDRLGPTGTDPAAAPR